MAQETDSKLQAQLRALNYLRPFDNDVAGALRRFARLHRMPEATVEAVEAKLNHRFCSVPDQPQAAKSPRLEYAASGCKWNKRTLKYFHSSFNPKLDVDLCKRAFREAADAWSAVCNLTFVEASSAREADINTGWEFIDGQGGTKAYAYLPGSCGGSLAGVLRVDLGDRWTLDSLRRTLTHELGHVIGFYHADRPDSIMWPYSDGGGLVISPDDAKGARAVYGPPNSGAEQPASSQTIEFKPTYSEIITLTVRKPEWRGHIPYKTVVQLLDRGSPKLVLALASSIDCDLYVAKNRQPRVVGDLSAGNHDFDWGSHGPSGIERIEIDLGKLNPAEQPELHLLVQAYDGASGTVTLTVTGERD